MCVRLGGHWDRFGVADFYPPIADIGRTVLSSSLMPCRSGFHQTA